MTKYADQFISEIESIGQLDYLKINIQEPEAHGINRVIGVELNAFGNNEVRAQGIRESWVIGRAEAISEFLKQYESALVTNYRKFGLNLNALIFIAMLVAIPEIEALGARTVFAVAVFFPESVRLVP